MLHYAIKFSIPIPANNSCRPYHRYLFVFIDFIPQGTVIIIIINPPTIFAEYQLVLNIKITQYSEPYLLQCWRNESITLAMTQINFLTLLFDFICIKFLWRIARTVIGNCFKNSHRTLLTIIIVYFY